MGDAQGQSGVELPVFFWDENHCGNRHLHLALSQAGIRFEKHTDHFERGVEDATWIPAVARHNWVVLTADARIRYNALEREAVKQHAVRLFYFARNDFSGVEMGSILSKAMRQILHLCEAEKPPFAASINRNGDVTLRNLY